VALIFIRYPPKKHKKGLLSKNKFLIENRFLLRTSKEGGNALALGEAGALPSFLTCSSLT